MSLNLRLRINHGLRRNSRFDTRLAAVLEEEIFLDVVDRSRVLKISAEAVPKHRYRLKEVGGNVRCCDSATCVVAKRESERGEES